MDAITFIPTKDIQFVGFSVYAIGQPMADDSMFDEFTCHWKVKIGDK
jgi:hypothetical protein